MGLLYGSLYPFHFVAVPSEMLAWTTPAGLSGVRDYILNVTIYLPFGFLLVSSLPRSLRTWRVAISVIVTFLFSGVTELIQAFDQGRFSSLIDLLLNTLGGGLGAFCALVVGWRMRPFTLLYRNPGPALLVLFALASHLYPFFPIIHRDLLLAKWNGFLGTFAVADVFIAAAEWLAVWILIQRIYGREVLRYIAFAMLSVPAGMVIVGQPVTGASFLGALAALAIGHFWRPSARMFAPWLLAILIVRELLPFHFSSLPQAFEWMPFSGFLESFPGSVQILLDKLFFYGATVWMWDPDSHRPLTVAVSVAALLAVLEWIQRAIPGRTPEITDSLLVVLVSGILWCLARVPVSQQF